MTIIHSKNETITRVMQRATQSSADALAEMVNQNVSLQLENVRLVGQAELVEFISQEYQHLGSLIQLPFLGSSSGLAMLIFPKGQDDLLLQAALPEVTDPEVLADYKPSVLTEAGNVLLNACIGTMANELEIQVTYDLPQMLSSPTTADILSPGLLPLPENIHWLLLTSRLGIGALKITIFILVICKPSLFD